MTNQDLTLYAPWIALTLVSLLAGYALWKWDKCAKLLYAKEAHQRRTFTDLLRAEQARDLWKGRYERTMAYRRQNPTLPKLVLLETQNRREKINSN